MFETDRLAELASRNAVPGAQLAVATGAELVSVTTGVVRFGLREPVTPDTAFLFGSVTKAVTATLVLQLVADGDLDLDVAIGEVAPEFRGPRDTAAASITPRHLLTHTAGLVADHELGDSRDGSLFRYAAEVAELSLVHRPGTAFSYSNTGYALLGRLVEQVTGVSWRAAMRDFLLSPLGIEAYFVHGGDQTRSLASGHATRLGRPSAVPVSPYLAPSWAPASGLAGSAEDLVTFARLHTGTHPQADIVLDDEHRARLHAPDPTADAFGMADGWGLGLAHHRGPNGRDARWLGHDGTVDGGTCHLRFQPETDTVVALTTNATTGAHLWLDVVAELRALGVPVGDSTSDRSGGPRTSAPVDRRTLDGLAGDYANGDTVFTVTRHPDGFRLRDRTGLAADLAVHDRLVFTARRVDTDAPPYLGRFVVDGPLGEVRSMQLAGRSATRLPGRDGDVHFALPVSSEVQR